MAIQIIFRSLIILQICMRDPWLLILRDWLSTIMHQNLPTVNRRLPTVPPTVQVYDMSSVLANLFHILLARICAGLNTQFMTNAYSLHTSRCLQKYMCSPLFWIEHSTEGWLHWVQNMCFILRVDWRPIQQRDFRQSFAGRVAVNFPSWCISSAVMSWACTNWDFPEMCLYNGSIDRSSKVAQSCNPWNEDSSPTACGVVS